MDLYSDEFIALFRSFEQNKVQYLIVGGFATNFHGYHRTTGDIDIWVLESTDNRKALIKAFEEMGFGTLESLHTATFLPGFCEIILDSGMYIELMDQVFFYDQSAFEDCYHAAEINQIEGVTIRYISFHHHIKSKKESNRLKDRLDVQELEKLQKNYPPLEGAQGEE